MSKAYSYIRFSRPEQMKGDSLRRQMEATRRYAAEHSLDLVEEMADYGLSAYHGEHTSSGALGKFLELVESGKIERGSTLIVESLDRLSRQKIWDALNQLRALIEAGIRIVTLMDKQVYDEETINGNPMTLLISISIMHRAHDESKSKGDRVANAWLNKRKLASQGEVYTARVPAWLRKGRAGYELIPARAAIVRRIYQMSADGVGRASIAKILNAEGAPTLGRGTSWHDSAVQKLLDNPVAMGAAQPQTKTRLGVGGESDTQARPDAPGKRRRVAVGAPIPDIYPAAVEPDLWWRAQDARKTRRKTGGRLTAEGPHILSGLCRCAVCGGTVTRVYKGTAPKGGTYLQCSTARRAAGCTNRRLWRYAPVEQAVVAGVARADLERILGQLPDTAGIEAEIAELEAKVARAETTRAEWRAAFEESRVKAARAFAWDQIVGLSVDIETMQKHLVEARHEYAGRRAALVSPRERQVQVAALHSALAEASADERLLLRARLGQELKQVGCEIRFSPITVSLAWGLPKDKAEKEAAEPQTTAPKEPLPTKPTDTEGVEATSWKLGMPLPRPGAPGVQEGWSLFVAPDGLFYPILFAGDAGQVEAEASASGVELEDEAEQVA